MIDVYADEMQSKFGDNSIWVFEILRYECIIEFLIFMILSLSFRGIDRNEGLLPIPTLHDIAYKLLFMLLVKDKGSIMTKSMVASKNLPKAITKPSEGRHWIRVLAAELALRLNDARQLSPNLWPKSLVLYARKGARLRTSFDAILEPASRFRNRPFEASRFSFYQTSYCGYHSLCR